MQIAAFTKNHTKRKKRGRVQQQVAEEPVATRMKVPGDQAPGAAQGLQVPQINQVPQIIQFPQPSQGLHYQPQGPPMPHVAHLPPNGSYGHVGIIGQIPTPLVDANVHFGVPVSSTQSMQKADVVMVEKDQISTVTKETLSEAQGTLNTTPVVDPQMVTPIGNPEVVTPRPNVTYIVVKPDPEAQEVLLNVPSASGKQVPAVSGIASKVEGVHEVKTSVKDVTSSIAEIIPQTAALTTEMGLPKNVANMSAPPISTLSIDQVQDADGKLTGVLSAFQVDRESVLLPGITPAPLESGIPQNPTNQVDEVPLANGELHTDILNAMSQG